MRFDPEQRFTCQQCARCCTRPWSIVVTAAEREDLRQARAERFFRESESAAEGAQSEAFEPLSGGLFAIRKRADGTCGFLSPERRCRLHEELGARRKPLACQVFPFRLHGPAESGLMTISSACPTVVRETGQALSTQARELRALGQKWAREFPEPQRGLELAAGHVLAPAALARLVELLLALLERPGPAGTPDLRANVARMAALLEDLSRLRVRRLSPERFLEYLTLVGRHAVATDKSPAARVSSPVARLLFRGFLFGVLAARVPIGSGGASGSRLGSRVSRVRLLLHLHGLLPAPRVFDRKAPRRAALDLEQAGPRAMIQAYLRRSLRGLGAGRRPVLDELVMAVALLNVAMVLAAARAAQDGRGQADERDLESGLTEASDLSHLDEHSLYARLLSTLTGGLGTLDVFASGRDGISRQPAKA